MCHMGSIILFLSKDMQQKEEVSMYVCEKERKGGKRRLLPCTQKLIKSFEIATEGTCMQSSQGKGLMRLCEARG